MSKHPGDDGDWHDSGALDNRMTIRERVNTQLGVTSPEVVRAMEAEEAFLRSVNGPAGRAPFTDRRPIPGRKRENP